MAHRSTGKLAAQGATALDAAGKVLRAADAASHIGKEPGDIWRRRILWVDDQPDNITYERQVLNHSA